MRHFTVIIAALLFLSFTAGGALAGNQENNGNKVTNGKKIELTEQEMDTVTAGAPAMLPAPLLFLKNEVLRLGLGARETARVLIRPLLPPPMALK